MIDTTAARLWNCEPEEERSRTCSSPAVPPAHWAPGSTYSHSVGTRPFIM